MPSLMVIFQRNEKLDSQDGDIKFKGYDLLWEDDTPAGVNMQKFCQHGVRTLLGRNNIADRQRVELTITPVNDKDIPLPKLPQGARGRRMYLEMKDGVAKFHFNNGTPTELMFNSKEDDPRILAWAGIDKMKEGQQQWLDLMARTINDNGQPLDQNHKHNDGDIPLPAKDQCGISGLSHTERETLLRQ